MNAITVVGAGPVGLRTATNLASKGWQVNVIEEHSSIGKPVQCAGLISANGARVLGFNLEECVVNQVKGAKIYSPDGTEFKVEKQAPVALVIDREKLDKTFYHEAKRQHVEVKLDAQLIDARNETLFLKRHERGELEKARIIVGADGVNSKVRQLMQLEVPKDKFVHAIFTRASGSFDPDFVEMHFGDFAPGFFAWVIPESRGIARIGLAAPLGQPIKANLHRFIEEKKMDLHLRALQSALIPMGAPLQTVVKDNMMLVGDAAFQTKSTTGGGIITGCMAADALSLAVDNHFKAKKSLADYNKFLEPVSKELQLHWKLRRYLNNLDEKTLNKLFHKMNRLKINEFLEKEGDMDILSRFLPRMLRSPKYFSLFPQAIKFFLS